MVIVSSRTIRKHTNTSSRKGIKSRISCGPEGICNMIEEFDQDPQAKIYGPGTDIGGYAQGGWYDGNGRVAKAGWGASATTGGAEAKASFFGIYAEGPSAGAGAEAYQLPGTPLAGAKAGAELSFAKAGAEAGPVRVEANLNLNTSASVSTTHVSANFLGFGFSLGSKMGISTPLGSITIGI